MISRRNKFYIAVYQVRYDQYALNLEFFLPQP